jgi:hypothetical protein
MLVVVLAGLVDLTDEQRAELRTLTNSPGVAATVATRARSCCGTTKGCTAAKLGRLLHRRGRESAPGTPSLRVFAEGALIGK